MLRQNEKRERTKTKTQTLCLSMDSYSLSPAPVQAGPKTVTLSMAGLDIWTTVTWGPKRGARPLVAVTGTEIKR